MSDRAARFYDVGLTPDQRSPFQRDRDRVLYTSAFRRLAGITQVVAPTERYLVHNRLTHTLEVAQVARRLAEKLLAEGSVAGIADEDMRVDPDVAESAALSHDLGHPPFGHVAEEELDRLANREGDKDGFNGNAQSFRVLTKLAVRYHDHEGLNLTRAALDAVLKYPWFRQTSGRERSKWGAYRTEQSIAHWVRPGQPWDGSAERCFEAEIMDWADDIAYAVHDVEDFYRARLIPLDRLAKDELERDRFIEARREYLGGPDTEQDALASFVEYAQSFPLPEPYSGTRQQRSILRGWTSFLIGRHIGAMTWEHDDTGHLRLSVDPQSRFEVAILKQLTWHYVIEQGSLAAQQHGQRRMIRKLFEVFHEDAHATTASHSKRYTLFPPYYRELLEQVADNTERTRLVIDLIASMTEHQVVDTYQRLTGIAQGSAFDLL